MKNVCVVLFALAALSFAQTVRSTPPAAGPAPSINLPDHQSFTLPNGLRVFVIENHKLPVLSLQLVLDYDPVLEDERTGFVSATGKLLRTGTKTHAKDELDKEIDLLGASISTSETGSFTTGLSKFSARLFELTADIIINSDFRQTELDKIKQQMISGYTASKEEPSAIAARVIKTLYYGPGHPYGDIGTDRTFEKIMLEDCRNFYTTYFRPNIAFLAIVGDITPAAARQLTEKYFGVWEKADVPKHSYPVPQAPAAVRVAVVDRPAAVQSVMSIGHPVPLHLTNPDIIHARLMNTILGGGSFRLFKNLRETHGYTYGAYSTLSNDKVIGSLQAYADVRNAVTDSAISQTLSEMNRMRDELVPDEELTSVKNYLTGNFAISLENPQTVANFAVNVARYGLKNDFYKNYLKELADVTAEQVRSAAQNYVLPGRANIIIVGKADEITARLKQFSPAAEIEYYDVDGKKIEPPKEEKPSDISAEQVIEKSLEAMGGKQALLNVKDKTTIMTGKMQGFEIVSSLYQKAPNKYLMKRTFSNTSQSLLFDGAKGTEKSPAGDREITGAELEKLKFQSDIAAMAKLDAYHVKANFLSKQTIEGKELYKIELLFPSGLKIMQYYDVTSGLKVREEVPVTMPQGTFTQLLIYEDYQEVSGMRFPFTIKQSMGSIKLELKVTKLLIDTGIKDSVFSLDK